MNGTTRDGNGTFWIAPLGSGNFTASVNVSGGAGGVNPEPAGHVFDHTMVTSSFPTDPDQCPTKTTVVTMTVNNACTEVTAGS